MPDPQSPRQVRILQTRRAEPPELSEEAALPSSPVAGPARWKWIACGIVLALLAAITAVPVPALAVGLGLGSMACFFVGRPAAPAARPAPSPSPLISSPESPPRTRISATRREGRRGVKTSSRTKNCAACHHPLGRGPTTTCTSNEAHVVHRRCKDLMRGKCPHCGNLLR